MIHSENVSDLFAALAKAQGSIESAKKDADNPFFKTTYADLSAIVAACRPHLSANGLAVTHLPSSEDGTTVAVTCLLTHASGQWLGCKLTLKPTKTDPQGLGSAITYGRRYTLASIVGVVTSDDDGNAASGNAPAPENAPPPNRPAPKKPATPPVEDARTALAKIIDKWSGVKAEDRKNAQRQIWPIIVAACNIPEKPTGEDFERAAQWVDTEIQLGVDFTAALKGDHK